MQHFITQRYRDRNHYQGIIFFDRDGIINEEVNYLRDATQIILLSSVIESIQLLNKQNIAVIVITNQPVVARGLLSIGGLKKINDTLVMLLKQKGVFIDAIYSCPHHPEKHHADIPKNAMKYRIQCACRKPGLVMYSQAIKDYQVSKIFGVIGDQTRDILAGKNLGVPTALVQTGYKGNDGSHAVVPDFVCDNLLDAVGCLLHEKALH